VLDSSPLPAVFALDWGPVGVIIAVYALMLVSFVAVPARILGAKKKRLRPKEAAGRWTVGGALSAVAMTPGSSSTASA
jgi:hypothetical protein